MPFDELYNQYRELCKSRGFKEKVLISSIIDMFVSERINSKISLDFFVLKLFNYIHVVEEKETILSKNEEKVERKGRVFSSTFLESRKEKEKEESEKKKEELVIESKEKEKSEEEKESKKEKIYPHTLLQNGFEVRNIADVQLTFFD